MKILVEGDKNLFKYEASLALLFSVGLMAVFFYLGTINYEVNDDIGITALVKGLFGLAPSAEGIFISPFLGKMLFILYKFFPAVSWFSLFLYVGVTLSCFLGGLTILMTIRTVSGKVAGLIGVAYFISFPIFQVNFATVSLLLWVTGCAFLVCAVRRHMKQNVWFWLASLHLAGAYLLRPSLLPLLILFAAPLFLSLLLEGGRRVAWCVLAPLIVALILSQLIVFVVRGADTYSEYEEFNKIRSEFNDTTRALRNPLTPQALFAAKWSNEDYLVAVNWWLHDNTFFNSDQIRTFLDENSSRVSIFNISSVKQSVDVNIIHLLLILFWIFVLFLAINPRRIKSKRISDPLLYFYLLAVVLFLMGVRFPPRVAYPCFLMLFLNSWIIFDEFDESNVGLSFLKTFPSLFFLGFLIYLFVPVVSQEMERAQKIKENKKYMNQSLTGVLQLNGSDSIIVDVTPHMLPPDILPFQENDPMLKTRILLGGWLVGAPVYLDFLQREGLGDHSTAVARMIDNRRIVFRYWDSSRLPFEGYLKNIFLPYLRQHYTVPGSGRYIYPQKLKDDRQGNNGLVYFQLLTGSTSRP